MTVERIDWQTAAAAGDTVEIGALVAGLPYLIVGDGVTVSAVTWTDEADTAWHVGTSPDTRGWLAMSELMIEERIRPVDGGIDVSSVTLRLADIALGPTGALGAAESLASTTLSTGISATVTTIGVRSTAAFAASGVAHIGRERITYTGVTAAPSATLTGVTRGTAGTKARTHKVTQGQAPPRVYQGDALPFTLGRRVTLWALRVTSAGTVTDPTLIYDGRIGPGTRMSDQGATWEIPVDHASRALAEPSRPVEVLLYGWSHFTAGERTLAGSSPVYSALTPLAAEWAATNAAGDFIYLHDGSGQPDHGGWSPSWEVFSARWNDAARTTGAGSTLHINADQTATYVLATAGGAGRRLTATWAWGPPGQNASPAETGDAVTQGRVNLTPPTEACVFLRDRIHLDGPDLALIPAAPTPPTGIVSQWGLDVERDNGLLPKATVRLTFSGDDGANLTGVNTLDLTGVSFHNLEAGNRAFGPEILITAPVLSPLRLYVKIDSREAGWWDAIRYGIIDPIDALRGLDHIQDSIAWDRIEALAEGSQPWQWERRYWVKPEDPPFRALRDEAALSGLMLCTWRGRIAVAKIREPSLTETPTRTIGQADLRRGQHATMREVSDGIISSMRMILPPHDVEKPSVVRVIDATAVSESGAGAEIAVRVAEGAVPAVGPASDPALRTRIENIALNLLAPWTRPYRLVTVPTDLRAVDVEVGDVIALEEWLLPDGTGGRGISGRGVCVGHRRDYRGGRVDLMLRVSRPRSGWAPSYLAASISGGLVTLQNGPPWGPSGFASDYDEAGAVRADLGLEYLAVGDQVRVVQINARTPATPVSAEVTALDPIAHTVTLDTSPGVTFETLASAGDVLLIPDTHANSTATQREYVYVAEGTTVVLSTGDPAATWA